MVGTTFVPGFLQDRRKREGTLLALCWMSGWLLGILVHIKAGNSLFPLMRSTPGGAVSIVSLLFCAAFPFLISAAAVYFSRSALFVFAAGKAFLDSLVYLGISQAYGCGGWLLARLVLFSNWTLLPLLYFLWLRLLTGCSGWGKGTVLAFAVLMVSVDYRFILPILGV